ncbi:sensor histidine kinase [Motilibacter sp. E257]|uniref:histidine kinase n=2 Tax=Motilibacter deserti TaxID=2714956 RepID=A0ABX0GUC2_9ACTN|nr:sensor histidine kinase [Motilibacter deserti]
MGQHPTVPDGAVAVCLAVLALLVLKAEPATENLREPLRDPDALAVALTLAYTLPLVLRRRHPLALLPLVVPAVLASVLGYPPSTAVLSGLLLVYTAALQCPRRQSFGAFGVVVVAYLVATAFDAYDDAWAGTVAGGAMFFGAWAFGRAIRYRRAYTAELEARAQRLEAEREAAVRATLSEERARIAREMHDVVAHSISVMTVQASAARRMADRDIVRSKEAMAAVEDTGRAALMEMRRILGVLRDVERPDDALAPQPGTCDLPDLVGKVREAGLGVELQVEGGPRPLPAGVELAVYRIVQEALTNTLKHAGPAQAQVRLCYRPAAVEVEVRDSGRGAAVFPGASGGAALRPGHGLVGMRERVSLYGGSLQAGPGSGGGYVVNARIPVEQVRA